MTAFLCSTLQSAAPLRRLSSARELRAKLLVEPIDLATLGSLSTVAVALVSAVALAVLGGA